MFGIIDTMWGYQVQQLKLVKIMCTMWGGGVVTGLSLKDHS